MKESIVVKNILKSLGTKYPGFYFKTHGGPFQMSGLPDILGVHRGRFIGIEVKAPGEEGDYTPKQQLVVKKINAAGGIAFMATSAEQVLEVLERRLNE